ncbi:MAG: NAD(P)-dependent oxidoreductase [Candidatus Omnitrophica bacterium]|nr:NAD(P)-dependent oxidoreductase [Candidatus Omnitrophota bacterium]
MNIFITGGTGYIGGEVTRRLLDEDHGVTIFTRDKVKLSGEVADKVKCIEGDIADSACVSRLDLKSLGIDIVIHLAASLDYFGDMKSLFKVNVLGTENILKVSLANGVNKFILASSIEAMGLVKRDDMPASEVSACRPVSAYGASKLEAERLVRRIWEKGGLDATILRLANVYGPGSHALIEPIAKSILRRDELFIHLAFYNDRYIHPLYISDAGEAFIRACRSIKGLETYIIGGPEYVEIGTIFTLISSLLTSNVDRGGYKKDILEGIYLKLRIRLQRHRKKADLLSYFMTGEAERVHRAYSTEKAKKKLSYSPRVNIEDGVEKTLQWLRTEGLLTL